MIELDEIVATERVTGFFRPDGDAPSWAVRYHIAHYIDVASRAHVDTSRRIKDHAHMVDFVIRYRTVHLSVWRRGYWEKLDEGFNS